MLFVDEKITVIGTFLCHIIAFCMSLFLDFRSDKTHALRVCKLGLFDILYNRQFIKTVVEVKNIKK